MKVVILTDERYAALDALWKQSQGVGLKAGTKLPKLPGPVELHKMARNGSEPEAFTRLREQQEAVNDAADQIREQMHGLIVEADAVGVKPGVLARWSGYSDRRIHQIAREGD